MQFDNPPSGFAIASSRFPPTRSAGKVAIGKLQGPFSPHHAVKNAPPSDNLRAHKTITDVSDRDLRLVFAVWAMKAPDRQIMVLLIIMILPRGYALIECEAITGISKVLLEHEGIGPRIVSTNTASIPLGSFAKAADRLGRSTSAVSAQIKKLEEQTGAAIFRKVGRGLALTDAGETLLSYARRLLDLNDEAVIAVQGTASEGWLRVGLQEDFGETLLPRILGRFARAHPKVKIEARVARNAELLSLVMKGRLDFALTWDDGGSTLHSPYRAIIAKVPVRWIGAQDQGLQCGMTDELLPLVAYDDSCWFRTTGTTALDRAGRPWRVALTSPSLAGIWGGVSAGLGVTIRTPLGLSPNVRILDEAEYRLPKLGSIAIAIHRKDMALDPLPERLATIVAEEVHTLCE